MVPVLVVARLVGLAHPVPRPVGLGMVGCRHPVAVDLAQERRGTAGSQTKVRSYQRSLPRRLTSAPS